jgi:hypothetical protein
METFRITQEFLLANGGLRYKTNKLAPVEGDVVTEHDLEEGVPYIRVSLAFMTENPVMRYKATKGPVHEGDIIDLNDIEFEAPLQNDPENENKL